MPGYLYCTNSVNEFYDTLQKMSDTFPENLMLEFNEFYA